MNKEKSIRLLLVVGLLVMSSGLVAYSAMGVKHQVGSDQVGEVAFTHLSHAGFIQRGTDGKLAVLDGYVIKGGEAVEAEVATEPQTPAVDSQNGKMMAAAPIASVAQAVVASPAPKKTTVRKSTAKKTSVKSVAKPAAKKTTVTPTAAKKPAAAKPATPATAPAKKPAAKKPACPT